MMRRRVVLLLFLFLVLTTAEPPNLLNADPTPASGFFLYQSVEEGRPDFLPPQTPFNPDAQCTDLRNELAVEDLLTDPGEFLYSQSYRSTTNDDPAYAADQLISSPNDGLYTRFAFRVKVTAEEDFASSYTETFTMVDSEGGCTRASQACPSDESCTELFRTDIEVDIANITVPYRLQRIGFSPTSPNGGGVGSEASQFVMPFTYLPIDDYTGTNAPCSDFDSLSCEAGTECMLAAECSSTPCDSDGIAPAVGDPSAAIAGNCGVLHDPLPLTNDLLFPGELNQRCVSACCAPCDAMLTSAYHERWALGTPTYAFGIQQADRILADFVIRTTVTNSFNGTVTTRTVRMLQQDLGAVQFDEETGQQVRVTINDISAELYNALPDMTGGAILVWDYGNGTTSGLVSQSTDPYTNPYTALPNEGFGLTPTENNLGLGFGWAYLNDTRRLGAAPGQYGASQAMLTSATAQFGAQESCYNDYYPFYKTLPGWEMVQPADNTTGPVPRVETACQISHLLNQLTADIVGGAPASSWTGQWYMPPHYDFHRPNMWLQNGRLMVRIHQDAALFAALQNVGPGVGGTRQITDQGERMFQLFDTLVDVSEDLAQYTGLAKQAAFGQTTGCIYDVVQGKGQATVTVENPNDQELADFVIVTNCQTSDPTVLEVTGVQPATISTQVGANSAKQLQPINIGLVNVTMGNYTTVPDLSCFTTISLATTPNLIESSKTIECLDVTNVIRTSNSSLYNILHRNDTCENWGDDGCDETSYWIAWAVIIGAVVAVFLAVIILVVLVSVCKSKASDSDDQ